MENRCLVDRCTWCRLTSAFAVAFLLLLLVDSGKAAQQKPAAAPAPAAPKPAPTEPAAPPPVAVPLGDIATRAAEVSNLLGKLTASAAPSAQIESIAKTLPESSEKLDAEFAATAKNLEAEPTLDTLQSLQQDWQRRELETKGWLSALTAQATKLQEALNQLSELQKTWASTRASAQEAKAPGPILEQIDTTLSAITASQAKIQSERTALAKIGQIQQKAVAELSLSPSARCVCWATIRSVRRRLLMSSRRNRRIRMLVLPLKHQHFVFLAMRLREPAPLRFHFILDQSPISAPLESR